MPRGRASSLCIPHLVDHALVPASVQDCASRLSAAGYLADEGIATAVHLALALDKPLLVEGAPGVAKTAIAPALSTMLGRRLIRAAML